jgi:hypothetical protein
VDAVRGRIKRGSLESVKGDDGTVYVLLGDHDQADGQSHLAADQSGLVEGLRGQVDDLREQLMFLRAELVTRNEELRRKDHIIAALAERIPELEAAREPRDGPDPGSEASGKSEGRADVEKPSERRSWLVRFFFGP